MGQRQSKTPRSTAIRKDAFDSHQPFGRFDKSQRRELRVALMDGASIGEILLLVSVDFSRLDLASVALFLRINPRQARDLLRSARHRIDAYRQARLREIQLEETFADTRRVGIRINKRTRSLVKGN